MPFSSTSGKALVDRAVIRACKDKFLTHFKVLDVGAGSGTYSDRYRKTWLRDCAWFGLEVWEPYIEKYELKQKYNYIVNEDAREFFKRFEKDFDLCFMGDVLEHVTQDEARQMVDSALNFCSMVLISIPIGHYPQGEYDGNPHEIHVKDDWTMEEALATFPDVCFHGLDQEIGVLICSRTRSHEVRELLAPRVGVYGICKNELKFVDRFFDSIKEADAIVICDTGSTDGTLEKFEQLDVQPCKRHFMKKVVSAHVSPWRFDDARNISLMLLPEELDVCVSLDLDETLAPGWYEILCKKISSDLSTGGVRARYFHRFKTIWNWDHPDQAPRISEHWHERIHPRAGYMWKLPVHEILVKSDLSEEKVEWLPELYMIQQPDTSKPRGSYLGLLEMSVREDPSRWKSWSFLAGEYFAAGRPNDAVTSIMKAKECPGADKAYLAYQASTVYRHTGDQTRAILEHQLSVDLAPHIREYLVYFAQTLIAFGRLPEARSKLEAAKQITVRPTGYEYNPSCWDQSFDDLVNRLKEV